ncbi:MAG: hypothetical protein CTY12_04670 [Methylotenera sp.]|nr:MAG: hypothetical protein CTY12_04670 [Methylotenera sp.]
MMWCLTTNNRVILGPIIWSKYRFEQKITELGYTTDLPYAKEDKEVVVVNNDVIIRAFGADVVPTYDSLTEELVGPIMVVNKDGTVNFEYSTSTKPIYSIQNELIDRIVDSRKNEEHNKLTVTVQKQEVVLNSIRGELANFMAAQTSYVGPINWKFKNCWLTVDDGDIKTVINNIVQRLQFLYDWEYNKILEIQKTEKVEDLKNIITSFKE